MKNICDGCPQFNRVCFEPENKNKNYCFFHHGHREKQSFQCDDLMELINEVIDEANCFTVDLVNKNKFTIEEYGSKDYYILLLYFIEKGVQYPAHYPIGYIKKRSKED